MRRDTGTGTGFCGRKVDANTSENERPTPSPQCSPTMLDPYVAAVELILSAIVVITITVGMTEYAPRRIVERTPSALVYLRIGMAPFLVLDAYGHDPCGGRRVWTCTYVAAIFSDIYDGVIARRIGIATESLRTADSAADQVLFLALGASTWHVHQDIFVEFAWPLIAALISQMALFATWLIKFRRGPCCHGYSAKVWGLAMLVAVVALFGFNYKPLLWAAIICCIVNAVDEMIIALTLLEWDHDVKSVVHALRLRKALAEGAARSGAGAGRRPEAERGGGASVSGATLI